MPIMEAIGTGLVTAATFAFNPIPSFIGNPMLAGLVTIGLGWAILKFAGDGRITKILGAGVAIAGTVVLFSQLLGGQLGIGEMAQ